MAMGVEEVVTAPRSPWQNPYVERLIGSVRRECLNHVIVLNDRHLRRILVSYLDYYHRTRTHLSLGTDTPEGRPVQPDGLGKIVALPQVGGLQHRYERLAARTSLGSVRGLSGGDENPTGIVMDPPHFLPRRKSCRWQADKSKRRFQKTPCLPRGEKRIAAGGERSVDGPDEIKRRDSRRAPPIRSSMSRFLFLTFGDGRSDAPRVH
jgi:hypothetical protein